MAWKRVLRQEEEGGPAACDANAGDGVEVRHAQPGGVARSGALPEGRAGHAGATGRGPGGGRGGAWELSGPSADRSGGWGGRADPCGCLRTAGAGGFGWGWDYRGAAGQGFAVWRLRSRCDPGPGGPALVSRCLFGGLFMLRARDPPRAGRRRRTARAGTLPTGCPRAPASQATTRVGKRPSRIWRPGTARSWRRLRLIRSCARVPGTGRGRWPSASDGACGSPARTAPDCPPGRRAPGRATSRR